MNRPVTSTEHSGPSRFVVGLDLGTTNSAMAYVDTTEKPRRIRTFAVRQVVAPGQIEARETLPSFHYQPVRGEFPANALRLPWTSDESHVVGHFARDHGTLVPGRMIASAKSWLCHNGVDRTADLLPWHGAEDVDRLSPVTVSARYIQHFRAAWDAQFPDHPLAQQDFVLTLPASFDEVARELTIRAAQQAGLRRVVLIEEPQAAFYAWIDKHADSWEKLVFPGQTILVCDIGGGTTDFTLIRVRKGSDGAVQFHRVAVGDHLILGGDNLDLALAHHLESRIKPGGRLEPRQWSVLVRSCRHLKEVLLGADAPEQWTLTLPGSGSKLIGGAIQIPVNRTEVESLLVEGFLPSVPLDAKPSSSQSGFQEFGLPYAAEPAMTKHLAAFLTAHQFDPDSFFDKENSESVPPRPTSKNQTTSQKQSRTADDIKKEVPATEASHRPAAILFNGGVFASPLLRHRLIQTIERWYRAGDPDWSPMVLENERLDLAVAKGAAYYGMVRRGEGVRIAAGLARTYYIGVEKTPSSETSATDDGRVIHAAMCLLPAGIEPGHEVDLSQHQFELLVSQPIEFPIYVSSTRLPDRPGDLVAVDPEEIKSLPPIRTVLKTGKSKEAATIAVIVKAKLTEIGTLDLWCSEVEGKRTWKLLFDVRSATQTDIVAHDAAAERQGLFDDAVIQAAWTVIESTFGPPNPGPDSTTFPPIETAPVSKSSIAPPASKGTVPRLRPSQRANDTTTRNPTSHAHRPPAAAPVAAAVGKGLEGVLGLGRGEWPTSLLRELWSALIRCESGRWISAEHESRWLNLTGFSLRPGYGLAVDDWRCNETWKLLQGKLAFNTTACRAEWYILWRRIAGGLTSGQQQALSAPLVSQLKQAVRQSGPKGKGVDFGSNTHESAELLRLLGSCELLSIAVKQELGEILLEILGRPRFASLADAALWAFGRVGARKLVYGPLNLVVPPGTAAKWLVSLSNLKRAESLAMFATMQLARRTGDRYRDVDDATRANVIKIMERASASAHFRNLVSEVSRLESEDQSLIFGESLPKGLRIL